ncbi:MAG: hypothetical protein ACXWJC_06525 [Croceibacterium sp.]|jgi:hypothetical protein
MFRPGSILLWPVPVLDDRTLKAWKSARKAFELAQETWTQMVWNEEESDYAIEIAEGEEMKDLVPIWPDKTFNELLKIGFDGKVMDNQDRPYARRLRGILD